MTTTLNVNFNIKLPDFIEVCGKKLEIEPYSDGIDASGYLYRGQILDEKVGVFVLNCGLIGASFGRDCEKSVAKFLTYDDNMTALSEIIREVEEGLAAGHAL